MAYLLLILAVLWCRLSTANPLVGARGMAHRWYKWLVSSSPNPEVSGFRLYMAVLIPVLILLGIIKVSFIYDYTWLVYVVGFLTLIYGLDHYLIGEKLDHFVSHLQRQDVQAAYHDAEALAVDVENAVDDWSTLHQTSFSTICNHYFQCYFPVIFWFAVLGAPVVLLYRILHHFLDVASEPAQISRLSRMVLMLDWLPLRVLGLTFALVGNWTPTITTWRDSLFAMTKPVAEVLVGYVQGAIEYSSNQDNAEQAVRELTEMTSLIDRSLIIWLAVLGTFVVFA